jgi:hypothetical protein
MTTASTRPADPLARSASRLKRYVTENSHAQRPYTRRNRGAEQRRTPGSLSRSAADTSTAAHHQTLAGPRAAKPIDALAEMFAVQAGCAAWLDALPESLRDSATATALQEMIDLDLDAIAAVQPPIGYGRD